MEVNNDRWVRSWLILSFPTVMWNLLTQLTCLYKSCYDLHHNFFCLLFIWVYIYIWSNGVWLKLLHAILTILLITSKSLVFETNGRICHFNFIKHAYYPSHTTTRVLISDLYSFWLRRQQVACSFVHKQLTNILIVAYSKLKVQV